MTTNPLPLWQEICTWSDDDLARADVAALNLACADGLPGAEAINAPGCLRIIDHWSIGIREETERLVRTEFAKDPSRFRGSEPLFRMARLVTLLQNHCGVRYNPAKIPPARDTVIRIGDEFLHGAVMGEGGTCASLPVLYTAIARRIGYPVYLVSTGAHVLCRWDDPVTGERVNIEGATSEGLNTYPDERFRHWPVPIPSGEEEHFGYLQSQTPREDLLSFLLSRSLVCWNAGLGVEGVEALYAAVVADRHPHPRYLTRLVQFVRAWGMRLRQRGVIGEGFRFRVSPPTERRWPRLPWEWEAEVLALDGADRMGGV